MIKEYVSDIALQMGITISRIALAESNSLGCVDAQLLNISSQGHIVGTIVYKADLEKLIEEVDCDRLEVRIRSALSRLKILLDVPSESHKGRP